MSADLGWHPQCRCFALPILNTMEEFRNEEQYSKNTIYDTPPNFQAYIVKNKNELDAFRTLPMEDYMARIC